MRYLLITLGICVVTPAFAANSHSRFHHASEDKETARLADEVRAQVLSIPLSFQYTALTLPAHTLVEARLQWSDPEWPLPRVGTISGGTRVEHYHEYYDMIALSGSSTIRVGQIDLRPNCAWIQGTDVTENGVTRARTLQVYLAINADGVEGCQGPVKDTHDPKSHGWRAYLKLTLQGTETPATPVQATLKYGGVEYELQ